MKKIFFVISLLLVFVSCKKESHFDMFFLLNQQSDYYSFFIEEQIKNKIHQVENDSLKSKILEFDKLSKDYIHYIDNLTNKLLDKVNIDDNKTTTNNKVFSESRYVNELFFVNDKHSIEGKEFLEKTNFYKIQAIRLTDNNLLKEKIQFTLDTTNPLNREGKEIDWLEYHFKDFPMIAVITKLKTYKKDILQLENEFIDNLLSKNN